MFTMKNYSLRKNLRYMTMAFFKPRSLIDGLPQESSLLYGVVPFAVLVLLWELKNWLVYRFAPQAPSGELIPNFVPRGLSIGSDNITLHLAVLALVWMFDVVLFAGVVYVLSRLLRPNRVSTRIAATCYAFCAGTFGMLALVADAIFEFRLFGWNWPFLPMAHPLVVIVEIAYLTVFVQRQADIRHWQAIALVVPGILLGLVSHMTFLI